MVPVRGKRRSQCSIKYMTRICINGLCHREKSIYGKVAHLPGGFLVASRAESVWVGLASRAGDLLASIAAEQLRRFC